VFKKTFEHGLHGFDGLTRIKPKQKNPV